MTKDYQVHRASLLPEAERRAYKQTGVPHTKALLMAMDDLCFEVGLIDKTMYDYLREKREVEDGI